MDVRCEKCRTEYELDESKLKPGGVTVKCTNCGHMFKVRRRITAIGPAVSGPPTLRGDTPPASAPKPAKKKAPKPDPITTSEDGELTWLIRHTDGEIMTCRELATLQKWIVAGRVDRDCEISRTGKKWKLLGEIGELASFFDIADEARQVAGAPVRKQTSTGSHPHTIPRQPSGSAPVVKRTATPSPPARPSTPPASEPPPVQTAPPASSQPPPAEPASSKPSIPDDERATGAWATKGAPPPELEEPGGPTHGLARSVPTTDAAFASGLGDIKGEFENGAFIPTDQIDEKPTRPSGGAGKWVAAIAILLLIGGGSALYLMLFHDSKEEKTAKKAVDAAPAPPPADAAPIEEPPQTAAEIVAEADNELAGDTTAGLEVALTRLAGLDGDDAELTSVLVARARIGAALAQHSLDESETIDGAIAKKKAVTRARELADGVEKLAIKVLDKEPDNAAAMVARADALRIRNRPARESERWLRRALKIERDNRDAAISRAHLFLRDRRPRKARAILEKLPEIAGDVRATFLLARLDVDDLAWEAAKTKLATVLAAEPEHARATALSEHVESKLAVATSDPLPPEKDDGNGGDDDNKRGDDDDDDDDGSSDIDSYDRLLARADKLAESGNCGRATSYYGKALAANPAGVAALTGLGYCHLEARQFSSAYAKFRAALGISSRYSSALWGMGELYERQGLKSKAVGAYKEFIDAHPSSRRAAVARRKIESLGGGSDGGSGAGTGAGSGTGTGAGTGSGDTSGSGAGTGAGSGASESGDGTGSGSGADSGDHGSPTSPPDP